MKNKQEKERNLRLARVNVREDSLLASLSSHKTISTSSFKSSTDLRRQTFAHLRPSNKQAEEKENLSPNIYNPQTPPPNLRQKKITNKQSLSSQTLSVVIPWPSPEPQQPPAGMPAQWREGGECENSNNLPIHPIPISAVSTFTGCELSFLMKMEQKNCHLENIDISHNLRHR